MSIVFLIVLMICGVSQGEVYKVGESSGWTNLANFPYKSWAASKNFHVGDTIVFEYNKEFHNVVRVTHKNFNACNSTSPYATWATGNDSFTIKRPGHYYFICGIPGHCLSGQRVDIRVPKAHSHGPAQSPSPVSPPSTGPTPSGSITFGPSPAPAPHSHKNGCPSLFSSWKLMSSAVLLIIGFITY